MENTIPTTLHPEQAGQKAAVLPKTLFTRRVLHQLSFWCQKMQFYCSNFPLLPTTSQLCCYIGKHEKAKGLDYISKGRKRGQCSKIFIQIFQAKLDYWSKSHIFRHRSEDPARVDQPLRGRPLGFVCHAFISPWGRNECVTNEPQRTSAGRLRVDRKSYLSKLIMSEVGPQAGFHTGD